MQLILLAGVQLAENSILFLPFNLLWHIQTFSLIKNRFSKCGPQNQLGIVRDEHSWALLRDIQNQKLWQWGPAICKQAP